MWVLCWHTLRKTSGNHRLFRNEPLPWSQAPPCFSCGFLQDDSLELTAQTNIRLLHCRFSPPDFSDVRACRLAFPSRAASSGQTVSVFTAAAFNISVPLAGERGRLWICRDIGEPNTGCQSQLEHSMYGEKMFPKDVVLQSDLKKKNKKNKWKQAKIQIPFFLIWYIF